MMGKLLTLKKLTPKLSVPKAIHQVIVDHADGLHVGIADRAADKLEAAFL